MSFPTPQVPVDLSTWLDSVGETFVTIQGHESGCTSYGVQINNERWFVKAGFEDRRDQLHAAIRVHASVKHPAIVPLESDFLLLGEGTAIVYPWVDGESLREPHVPGAREPNDPYSAMNRLRRRPLTEVSAAYSQILDAHVNVSASGLVTVDFYDGCLIYNFETGTMHLVDLDLYSPPYFLDVDRQFGSERFMAPEEFVRGAEIDEKTSVFTLGRTGLQLLCEPGGDEHAFRGSEAQREVLEVATSIRPWDRYGDVGALAEAWEEASATISI